MKIGNKISALIVASVLLVTVVATNLQQQQSVSAFGFVERQQIGEFEKLIGDFIHNIIKNVRSPNSEDVIQFRKVTAQFERDVNNAVLNDNLFLIPGLVSQHIKFFAGLEDDPFITDVPKEIEYTQEVLRIFCKPCV
jgi:hypothetical protein